MQKTLFFIFATIEVVCVSGIIYGWTSLDGIFKDEAFYAKLCDNESLLMSQGNTTDHSSCDARVEKLNLVFLVSVSILCFVNFPAGIGIDTIGPRKMRCIST